METARGGGCSLPAAPAQGHPPGSGAQGAGTLLHVCARSCARGICCFRGWGRIGFPPQGCSVGRSSSPGGSRGWVGAAGPPARVWAGQCPVTTTSGHRWQGGRAPSKPPLLLPVWLLGHIWSCPSPSCSPTPGGPPGRGAVGSLGGSSTPRGCRAVESPCSWNLAAFPSAPLPKHFGGEAGRRPASSCAGLRLRSPRGGSRLLSVHGALLTQGSGSFPAGEGQV